MPDISKKVVVKGIRIGMAQRCADYWMRDPVPSKRSGKVMAEDVGAAAVMGLLADGCRIVDPAGSVPHCSRADRPVWGLLT